LGARELSLGFFVVFSFIGFSTSPVFGVHIEIDAPEPVYSLPDLDFKSITIGKSGDSPEHHTRPTFGLDHSNNQNVVDQGFRINENTFSIKDNFHTPFAEQSVVIGEVNSFESKIYAEKGLRVQEFLFGIPQVGDAHLAELGVEVWLNHDGNIQQVKAVQKSNVIDESSIIATHEKSKCKTSDSNEKCDLVKVSMMFLEPLKDKVMALKAIDFKNRYQITYLNEGVNVIGESLNPKQTIFIPSGVKGEGLLEISQISKYSSYWKSDDGRVFEKNKFGSFKEMNQQFERFQDDGDVRTRMHSSFGGILDYEQKRAIQVFDGSSLNSETTEPFAYEFPETTLRIDKRLEQKMLEQEQIAKEILEGSDLQARHH
jgi:hypothetical protein